MMMGREKFVFFDIDGTIYDYYRGIPGSTKEAVRLLIENGHHPVICTGRTRVMIFDEILDMGFEGIVAGGGTYIEWNGRLLFEKELPPSEVDRLVMIFRENGFASYPEGSYTFYYDPVYVEAGEDEIYRIYQKHIPECLAPVEFGKMRASKVSAQYTSKSNTQKVIEAVGDDYIWVDHAGTLFETIPKDFSKGTGIRYLIDSLGADMEDTCAFGDSFNDLDMLNTVKYGIVMGNGNRELMQRIPCRTEGMFEDGIYNALKRMGMI